jgi:hypothetical protein
MATQILQQVRRAVGNLNPQDVRNTSERPLAIRLVASSDASYTAIEDFLSPPTVSRRKRLEQRQALFRADERSAPENIDLEIHEEGLPCPEDAFIFSHDDPGRVVWDILDRKEDLGLPLSRYFGPFRSPVTERTVASISKENAIFSLMTALPNIAPSVIQLPWSVAEIGSDTAFLTVNQIRMLFLLAGASDRPIGYREQRAEIASIIAGAFGWRAVARELVGKIPFGGGLIPKAAVAYAGTYVVGKSAERLYRIGYGYTREERKLAYGEALQYGKKVARSILERHRASKE